MSQRKLNLVLALADGNMEELHRKFNRLGNHLDRQQFTSALCEHCPSIATMIASGVQGTNIVDHLFFHVDMNGDGHVSWDDLFDYAVGTANERLQRLPAECTRNYTFSRFFPRQDNVLYSTYYPEPDLLLLSSRHIPVQLLRPETMVPLQTFHPEDVGGVGVLPICSTYLGATETLAIAFNDMRLRLWSSMDKEVPTAAHPLRLDHMVTKLRAIPTISPSFLMGCDNGGNLVTFEASRHALGEPRVRSSLLLHSRKLGGISDFCLMRPQESRVVTAGYDRQLLWTDVAVQRSSLVGMAPCVLRHVEYFESHQCVIAVGHDNQVSSWVTHQSQKPCTMFDDPSRPHASMVIGVSCVPNTPQVLTCDVSGMVKVWDMRNFRCAQTFHAAEGFNADAESGLCKPLDDHDMGSIVNSFCYLEATREACAVVSSGVHMHMYDKGAQPQLAAHTPLNCIRFNPLSQTIMTLASTAVQIWDSDLGHLHAEVPKTCKEDMTTMTLDGVGRRMFIGTQGGEVEVRSCDGANSTLETHKMHKGEVTAIVYSQAHRALLSVGVDGFLSMLLESESLNTPQRQKLSNRPMLCMTTGTELGLIAAGGKNGSTYVMDVLPPRNEDSELKHNSLASSGQQVAVHCLTFLGSFPLLAVGYENGDVLIWSVRPLKESMVVLAMNLSVSSNSGRGDWKLGTTAHPSSLAVPKMKRCESEAPQASLPKSGAGSLNSTTGNSGTGSTNHSPTASTMQQYHNSVMTDKLLASVLGKALDDASVNSNTPRNGGVEPAATRPTCLAFDRVTHHLFIGTNRGHIQVWSMCPFLQVTELPTCLYPSTPLLSLENKLALIQKGKIQFWRPTLVCGVHAHRDEIVDLQVIPTLDIVASCGDDQRVLLFDMYGNRLAELSQGRVPDLESLAPFSSPTIDVTAVETPSTTFGPPSNSTAGTAPSPQQPQQDGDANAVTPSTGGAPIPPTKPKKIAPVAPGSTRKSRRPTVDRMLRQIYEPQVSNDPTEYKPADGHTIDVFDIDASSPSRNANSTKKDGGGLLVATGPGSKLRRKSSLLSQTVLDSLVSAAPDQAGQQCHHGQSNLLLEVSLKLPRRAHVGIGGASITGISGAGDSHTSLRAKREPEVSIADSVATREGRRFDNASPLPMEPDEFAHSPSASSRDPLDDVASSQDGEEPLLVTFDAYSDDTLGNTATYNASASPQSSGGPMLNLIRKRLSAVAQLIVAKSNIKTATGISAEGPSDLTQHMTIDRRHFAARLHPIYPPVDANSESNEKHLVTLLRNVGDASQDWLTDAMKRRIAEYASGGVGDHGEDTQCNAANAGEDTERPNLPLPPTQKTESPLRSRGAPRHSPANRAFKGTPESATAATAPSAGAKPLQRGASAAASSVDDIQWTANAVADMSPRNDVGRSPVGAPAAPPEDHHHVLPDIHATQTDVNLPAPSGAACDDPMDSTAAAALAQRGGDATRDVGGSQHTQQRSIHDWLVSTGKHLPQLKLSNETKLVVPTVATPMETLKLLHDAWHLAHNSGGTALHYLGIAGSEPGSPVKLVDRVTVEDSTMVAVPPKFLNRGSVRSAGGQSAGTRCSTNTPIVVGIAKIAELCGSAGGDASSSPPRQRSAGGGQLVLYGPKRSGGDDAAVNDKGGNRKERQTSAGMLLPLSPRGRGIAVHQRPDSQRSPRLLLQSPSGPTKQHEQLETQAVGIHTFVSPRVQSGNVYTSHVRHGHVPLGRSTATMQTLSRRGPTRPDAKTARISLLEDELKRCLTRRPPPEEPSWM